MVAKSSDDRGNNATDIATRNKHAKIASSSSSSTTTKTPLLHRPVVLLTILVVQNSAAALTGRYTRSGRPKEELFRIGNFLLVCEVAKLVLSLLLEAIQAGGSNQLWSNLRRHVWEQPTETLQLAPPALLYFASNTFRYVAQGNLQIPVFQIIFQSRLITTAGWSVVLLQRNYKRKQWICLITTTLGLILVVLEQVATKHKKEQQETHDNLSIGIPALVASCFLSSLASVYLEKIFKRGGPTKPTPSLLGKTSDLPEISLPATTLPPPLPPSLWIRNIQLAFFSIVIAFLQNIFGSDQYNNNSSGSRSSSAKPFFHGFYPLVWVQVAMFSGGGVLVAAVTKYADSVLKGLATAISMVVSSCLSAILLNSPLDRSGSFIIGATTILGSVYMFSNDWPSDFSNKNQYLLLLSILLVPVVLLLYSQFTFLADFDFHI
jgi:UDP-sugar transporter A1/2/3